MLTLVVAAILLAIAFPSYLDYVRRGSRSSGQQFLMDIAHDCRWEATHCTPF